METQIPVFSRPYRILAYRVCNRVNIWLKPYLGKQADAMKPILRKTKLFMSVEEYMSTAIFTTLIFFPLMLAVLVTIFTSQELPLALSLLMGFVFSAVGAGVIFVLFMIYPQYRVDTLKREIDGNIAYATTHMATIAGTGVPIFSVFKLVGDFEEYGEIAREFRKISRDIEIFGTDTITAISQAATETPSMLLKELLWGLISVIRSGGDMRRYLMEKAEGFMEAEKRLQAQYMDSLSLLAEMYTTIFVAGPVLLVVMITIMGSMGSLPLPTDVILSLATYIILPVMAVGFMLLVESSKPAGMA
jgi:flagellar protein FlaJ